MHLKQSICKGILNLLNWKVIVTVPEIDKSVICVAPHTSNWDFILGKLGYTSVGRTAHFLIKKEWFFFPFNLIFKAMGGIPVARSRKTRLIDQVVTMFQDYPVFNVAITPEGTRQRNEHWKKGFYYIALKAGVPIQLAYLDFERKVLSIEKIFIPTGDEKTDFAFINEYYKDVKAKYPEQFALNKIS
ncbi:MAG: 1-acyl-sn-glycerol-3-phosphate acyltransferase [Bacteroidales bacterium]